MISCARTVTESVSNMAQYVNVRRILLGHKRASKSPLLDKFIEKCVKQEENNFISSLDIFNEYKNAVELWTDGDSQAKILLKQKAFQRVSSCSVASDYMFFILISCCSPTKFVPPFILIVFSTCFRKIFPSLYMAKNEGHARAGSGN